MPPRGHLESWQNRRDAEPAKNRYTTGSRSGGKTRFRPGESGNPAGRSKGALNKRTQEAQELAASLIDGDPAYLEGLKRRIKAGKAPHMETLLWHHRFGKPKDQVDVSVSVQGAAEVLANTLTLDELKTLDHLVGRIETAQPSGD